MAHLHEVLISCVVLSILTVVTNGANMCYSCNHIAHPRDCDRVVQCKNGEQCNAVAYAQPDGNFYYNVGCLPQASCPTGISAVGRRDLSICNRCCNGHYCNKELCDGPPPNEQGPRCLKCETVEHPSQCGAVTGCAIGEICYTKEKYVFGERRYQLGCASSTCFPRTRDIFQRQAGSCQKCCSTENCNRDLCGNTGAPLTQAPATVPAYHPTTATTRPRTQMPDHTTHVYNMRGCHYRNKVYQEGQTWDESCDFRCTCLNSTTGRYVCQDICPTYVHVPATCHMEKPAGECCSHPVCKGTNVTYTNFTSTTLINECFYKGKTYKQDDTWRDGCEWECSCTDATKGYYKCHSLCYQWTLPPKCHLNEPAAGKCCKTPDCPAGYVIKYPPGYVEN